LDEIGFRIVVHGVKCMRDGTMRMVAKIDRGPGRLYVQDVEVAWPVCLAVVMGEDAWH
jgi:hypothetical protein